MPFDATDFVIPRQLTEAETIDLDVLRKCLANLRRPGSWCKNASTFGQRHCATGWVRAVVFGEMLTSTAAHNDIIRRVVMKRLGPALPYPPFLPLSWETVQNYNDSRATKKSDVVALFARAIAKIEGGT